MQNVHYVGQDLAASAQSADPKIPPSFTPCSRRSSIRDHLREWEAQQAQTQGHNTPKSPAASDLENSPLKRITLSQENDAEFTESREQDLNTDALYNYHGADEHEEYLYEVLDRLRAGSLVGVPTSHRDELAMVVQVYNLGGPMARCYTSGGRFTSVALNGTMFSVPDFATAEEIAAVLPYLSQDTIPVDTQIVDGTSEFSVPRHASSHILKKMLDFQAESNEFYRKYAHELDNAYARISVPNRLEIRFARDVTRQLAGLKEGTSITHAMTWAVHKAIRKTFGVVVPIQKPSSNFVIRIVPPHKVNTLLKVADWFREYQELAAQDTVNSFEGQPSAPSSRERNPIAAFVRKARKAVFESRRRRDATARATLGPDRCTTLSKSTLGASQPPSIHVSDVITFDHKDRMILYFFHDWVLSKECNVTERTKSVGPMLLRATGLYDGYDLKSSLALTFLKELGVILPWENRAVYRSAYDLPKYEVQDKEATLTPSSTFPVHRHAEGLIDDTMKAFRTEVPSSNVYCIDSGSTMDHDDGIQLEVVDQDTSWVHVHIANPSAFMDPKSQIAADAAKTVSNLYLPERRYSMYPSNFAKEHFSLAAGAPVITFSAKLSNDGEVLDTKISHGRLRDTVVLTYQQLEQKLQAGYAEMKGAGYSFEVGRRHETAQFTHQKQETALSAPQITELRKLWQLSNAFTMRLSKQKDPLLQWSLPFNSISVDLGTKHPPFQRYLDQPRRVVGDPWIASRPALDDETSPKSLVPGLMVMTSIIAAEWCKKRRIPAFFSGTPTNPLCQALRDDFYVKVAKPAIERHGYAPGPVCMRYAVLKLGSRYLPVPTPHEAFPAEAYLKVTSPLRRWTDIVAHWQIEAVLREEAKLGQEAVLRSEPDNYLPFTMTQIKDDTRRVNERLVLLGSARSVTELHWMMHLFFRAFYYQEAPLPDAITFTIFRLYPDTLGWATELGTFCEIVPSEATSNIGLRVGDKWECKLHSVDCSVEGIRLQPLRLIEKGDLNFL